MDSAIHPVTNAKALVEAIMDAIAEVARATSRLPQSMLSRWEERVEAILAPHLVTPEIARLAAAATAVATYDRDFRSGNYNHAEAYTLGERAEEARRELDRAVAAMAGEMLP